MIFFPAIDIKDGQCIRLEKGDLKNIKFYNSHPLEQAIIFEEAGCEWVHIVDIDAAFSGTPSNSEIIFKIKEKTTLKIQVGGGIRNIKVIENFLLNSVDRVVLGTVAASNPGLVIEACKKFPGKIAVGIDSKNNMVATEGWSKTSSLSTLELAKSFEGVGVSSIIFTDINKDGLLEGMSFDQINSLLEETKINVIASGGVSSLEDLKRLKLIKSPYLEGVISGKALYEGNFTIKEALKILSG